MKPLRPHPHLRADRFHLLNDSADPRAAVVTDTKVTAHFDAGAIIFREMEPETEPSYDNELLKVHLALAAEALPGPDYYSVLRWLHELLRPERYLEVGIRQGDSLRLALPETKCIGIDPAPLLQEPLPPNTRLFAMTSNQFFESQSLADIWGVNTFSLAFVDGLHLFEQALLDFAHLERLATPASIIIIHDCLPLEATTSERARSTHFYSGDVWKLALCLKNRRPDLKIKTIRTGPTGLCVVGNLQCQTDLSFRMYGEYVAEYLPLQFADYKNRLGEMPETVENTLEALALCIADLVHDSTCSGGAIP